MYIGSSMESIIDELRRSSERQRQQQRLQKAASAVVGSSASASAVAQSHSSVTDSASRSVSESASASVHESHSVTLSSSSQLPASDASAGMHISGSGLGYWDAQATASDSIPMSVGGIKAIPTHRRSSEQESVDKKPIGLLNMIGGGLLVILGVALLWFGINGLLVVAGIQPIPAEYEPEPYRTQAIFRMLGGVIFGLFMLLSALYVIFLAGRRR